MDLVVAEARRFGIKLIGEFAGDANGASPHPEDTGAANASQDWYCAWRGVADCKAFFTDPAIIGDYERHMRAVLNHVNPRTGLAYKDDPTFLGWVDGNNLNLVNGVDKATYAAWLRRVSDTFKSIDRKQLFIDISTPAADTFSDVPDPKTLATPGVDVFAQEWYPHWFPQALSSSDPTAPLLHRNAHLVAAAGKAYATIEFGWDPTDYVTPQVLDAFLAGLRDDPDISGDAYWALMAHESGHGWMPVPADQGCRPTCEWGEDGNWWALYYTGVDTQANTAADMATRAQSLRDHAYAMAGFAQTPPHERVPAPTITSLGHGIVRFQGSAGSPVYSVQTRTRGGRWRTPCRRCTTDADDGWRLPPRATCVRMIGYNLDGRAGPPSRPACRPRRR
jgi:hypothetical protein